MQNLIQKYVSKPFYILEGVDNQSQFTCLLENLQKIFLKNEKRYWKMYNLHDIYQRNVEGHIEWQV